MDDDYGLVPYKDISELKKELDGMQDKKEISNKDMYDAVHKLANAMSGMLGVFGAAAEQLKLEEKGYESESKKHETIISKLDKLIDQNKTIAEGMVAIVEMVKEKFGSAEKEESMFAARENEWQLFRTSREPTPMVKPSRQEWKPAPQPVQRAQPQMAQPMPPPMNPMAQMQPPRMPQPGQYPANEFGTELPPMQPSPLPDMDFPEEPFPLDEEEPRKKGLLGLFKK